MTSSPLRRTLAILVVLASVVVLPASAAAVLSGRDGRIVFVSGREGADGDDSQAKLYFWRSPPDAFSPAVGPALDTAAGQHRHPTWSPDRTKIAYARGTADSNPATQNFDIYIKDLVTGAVQPLTNTTDSLSADRPAWSPDGTRIAFEHQPTDASADRIIRIENVGGGGIDLTPAGAPLETKPAWTPDSQTLYYAEGDVNVAPNGNNNDVKIVREPADNTGSPTQVIHISGAHAFQPSISPDGTRICFTLSPVAGLNTSAAIFVAEISNPAGASLLASSGNGDYNCTWSPSGLRIAYVTGVFTGGALVAEDSDFSDIVPQTLTDDTGNFDGNPDWAPDAAPTCQDSTATTFVNAAVSIPLPCTDNGPAYERTQVNRTVVDQPQNGTLNQIQLGDTAVTYTPNPGFRGTNTFTYRSFDGFGFAPTLNTITVTVEQRPPVEARCSGRRATIVGTNGADALTGTPGADVIALLAGNDSVASGAGSDSACGGGGNDRMLGGSGNDRLAGDSGNDRLTGESGRDRLSAGSGRDRLSGGSGNDRLTGDEGNDRITTGPGRNVVSAGSGNDVVSARNGSRDRINCGSGRRDTVTADRVDRLTGCERVRR